jgi:hypothetical protein
LSGKYQPNCIFMAAVGVIGSAITFLLKTYPTATVIALIITICICMRIYMRDIDVLKKNVGLKAFDNVINKRNLLAIIAEKPKE